LFDAEQMAVYCDGLLHMVLLSRYGVVHAAAWSRSICSVDSERMQQKKTRHGRMDLHGKVRAPKPTTSNLGGRAVTKLSESRQLGRCICAIQGKCMHKHTE
jgi:hypothetical protein